MGGPDSTQHTPWGQFKQPNHQQKSTKNVQGHLFTVRAGTRQSVTRSDLKSDIKTYPSGDSILASLCVCANDHKSAGGCGFRVPNTFQQADTFADTRSANNEASPSPSTEAPTRVGKAVSDACCPRESGPAGVTVRAEEGCTRAGGRGAAGDRPESAWPPAPTAQGSTWPVHTDHPQLSREDRRED